MIIAVSGWQFRNASTTVNPKTPEKTSSLVTHGLYSVSRNPMYIGFMLWLTAAVLYSNQLVNIIFIPLFIALANKMYIKPEEQALIQLFTKEYTDYVTKVRWWI